MDFIKLVTAGASCAQVALTNEPYVLIDLYDASTTREGIQMWPWLLLTRGSTFYEARGFFEHGIDDDPFRRTVVDNIRNTTLREIGDAACSK